MIRLILISFVLMSCSVFAGFPKRSLFFNELLSRKGIEFQNLKIKAKSELSEKMTLLVSSRITENSVIDKYSVSYQIGGHHYSCEGAILKESDELNAAKLPIEFRDRAGLVLIGNCLKNNKMDEFNSFLYIVFPKDETLGLGDISKEESYNIYKKFLSLKANLLCTSRDSNSEGSRRSQSTIHYLDNKVHFYSMIATSSPPKEVDGKIKWSTDRALFFDEMDQGSIEDTKDTLNLLSHVLKGRISLIFDESKCISLRKDGMNLLSCYSDISEERKISFQTKSHKYTLSQIAAEFESSKVRKIQAGALGNNVSILEEKNSLLSYIFAFLNEDGKKKYYKMKVRYSDSSIHPQKECLFNKL